MTLGILRRQQRQQRQQRPGAQGAQDGSADAPAGATVELDPKPGAAQLIGELDELASLKDAGVLSEAEFARQRAQILAELI